MQTTSTAPAPHGLIPSSIPPIRPGDLVEFSETGFHIAGRCIEGPDADGWFQVESLVELHHTGGQDDTPADITPGDRRRVRWGRGLIGLVLELGADHEVLRAVRPVPVPPAERVEVLVKPSQPIPHSEEGEHRRRRAGNTIRKQTASGTWAPINVTADGERFQRQQITTKLHPAARAALDQLAADAGLRACEVLEALLLAPGAAAAVRKARPLGVSPQPMPTAAAAVVADRSGERRTRLTKAQGERLDQLLLEMAAEGRTSREGLEQLFATAAAEGIPAQPLATIQTRLRRLRKRPGGLG